MRKCGFANRDKNMYHPGAGRKPDKITYNYNYWYVIPGWGMALPGIGPAGNMNPAGYYLPFGGAVGPAGYLPAGWGPVYQGLGSQELNYRDLSYQDLNYQDPSYQDLSYREP